MATAVTNPPHSDIDAWSLAEVRRLLARELSGSGVKVWLFGSRARGDHRPFSDIDIALQAREGTVSPERMTALREAFEESRIPYRVDLVDLARADEALAERVRSEGIPWPI